jgi:hypothetical protein
MKRQALPKIIRRLIHDSFEENIPRVKHGGVDINKLLELLAFCWKNWKSNLEKLEIGDRP